MRTADPQCRQGAVLRTTTVSELSRGEWGRRERQSKAETVRARTAGGACVVLGSYAMGERSTRRSVWRQGAARNSPLIMCLPVCLSACWLVVSGMGRGDSHLPDP